jgi:tRNA 2-thiouridine synthesizing protein A
VAESEPAEHIDAIGLFCPEPVMLLHAAMRRLSPGAALTLRATDPSTQRDFAIFCEFLGHDLLASEQQEEHFFYHIRKGRR